jgi:hypothetical protein
VPRPEASTDIAVDARRDAVTQRGRKPLSSPLPPVGLLASRSRTVVTVTCRAAADALASSDRQGEDAVRIESSVTAISWIPEAAIEGRPKVPFELGIGHYDRPPPDHLEPGDLERLRDDDRFREANHLAAWIEVEDGRIVGHGYSGGGLVGATTFKVGPGKVRVAGVAFETLRPDPEVGPDAVWFVQTVGGRAGFPAPRMVNAARRSCVSTRRRRPLPYHALHGAGQARRRATRALFHAVLWRVMTADSALS